MGLETGPSLVMCSRPRDESRRDRQAAHAHGHGACSFCTLVLTGGKTSCASPGPQDGAEGQVEQSPGTPVAPVTIDSFQWADNAQNQTVSLAKISERSRLAHPSWIPEVETQDTYWRRPLGFLACWFTGSGPAPHALPLHSGLMQAPSSGAPL